MDEALFRRDSRETLCLLIMHTPCFERAFRGKTLLQMREGSETTERKDIGQSLNSTQSKGVGKQRK